MESFRYPSQVEWMRERARTIPGSAGRMINDYELLISVDTNMTEVRREYPDYSVDMQRFYAETRTFGHYWGVDNINQFPTPMKELPPKKASTSSPSKLRPPRLARTTAALPSIPRGSRAPEISPSTRGSNPALPSSPPALSNSLSSLPAPRRLEKLDRPPQDGWDADTGFPSGALVFQHPQAYPHLWGKDQILLQELNSNFPHLWIRLERTPDKLIIVVWVEVKGQSSRTAGVEKEGALNGLRAYHMYDTGELGELPWIGTFYRENHHLFHPGHRHYHVIHSRSTSSVGTKREETTRRRTTNTSNLRDRHYRTRDNRSRSPGHRRQSTPRCRSPMGMGRDVASRDDLIDPNKPQSDQNTNPNQIPIGLKRESTMKREMTLDELIELNKLRISPSSGNDRHVSLTVRSRPKEEVRGRGESKYYNKVKREYDEED